MTAARLISGDVARLGEENLASWCILRPGGEHNAMRGGDQRMLRGVHVGDHERSGDAIFLTPDGVKRGTRIARILEHQRWDLDRVFSATCVGVPWQPRPKQR